MSEVTLRPGHVPDLLAARAAAARGLRVVVAHADASVRQPCVDALARLGHRASPAATSAELADLCRQGEPDLVVADEGLPGLGEAVGACRERMVPVVLVTAHGPAAPGAPDLNVFGCLADAADEGQLGRAVALARRLFERARDQAAEVAGLRQQLEDRKVIERAKGAVSRRCGLDEARAYEALRKHASDHNRKLAEAAREIIDAEAVFARIEDVDGHRPPRPAPHFNGNSHVRR